ncbi:MAG: hypothetical protein M1482_18100 [Chloroflexi bacterium]|nr:hypothetical protein [Chloroflexota bacterium]
MALHDIDLPKDIVVATPEEAERRRNGVGTIIKTALQDGELICGYCRIWRKCRQ